MPGINQALSDFYRCPERFLQLSLKEPLSSDAGYFKFGTETVCYGQSSGGFRAPTADAPLFDASSENVIGDAKVNISFNPTEAIANLRLERYTQVRKKGSRRKRIAKGVYYLLRPYMPTKIRRRLQRFYFLNCDAKSFPAWPVDRSVENLCETLLLLLMKAQKLERIPLIWFWPDGAPSCAIMTHDVETTVGRDFCPTLMDIDDRFGIKSSFQIVPEDRYEVTPEFLEQIRNRGFEVVVHDLNHDGLLFKDRQQFESRAQKINSYGEQFGATGFRAAVLYRNQAWFDALKFSYDMSVPNVAHMDPQHGGCCTVMPYFIGDVLELPVTATQDYTMFHVLKDYSLDLWKQQVGLIMQKHGLISFIVHPDYILQERERTMYEALLGYMSELRDVQKVWTPTPSEVNQWWRQRSRMTVVEKDGRLRIEGPGSERACIAYASERNGQLAFTVESNSNSGAKHYQQASGNTQMTVPAC